MKSLKKFSGFFSLALAALVLFASCEKDDEKKLKFSSSTVTVEVGKTSDVTVSGGAAPYTPKSSADKVASATVSKNTITIKGVAAGNATITITDKDKNTGTVSVTVKDAAGLDFDKKQVEVAIGKEEVVTIKGGTAPYTVTPKDTKIATTTEKDGKITVKGVAAGTTTITVTDKDKKTGTVSVTVK